MKLGLNKLLKIKTLCAKHKTPRPCIEGLELSRNACGDQTQPFSLIFVTI
jgi:hypothetical protein